MFLSTVYNDEYVSPPSRNRVAENTNINLEEMLNDSSIIELRFIWDSEISQLVARASLVVLAFWQSC